MALIPGSHHCPRQEAHVWHPYTEMGRGTAPRSIPWSSCAPRARGFYDADGTRLYRRQRVVVDLDSRTQSSAAGRPRSRDRRRSLCHTAPLAGIAHPAASGARRANRPRRLLAGLEHVFYSDDGSTSVEVAMKLALQYWEQNGRPERTAVRRAGGGVSRRDHRCDGAGRGRGLPASLQATSLLECDARSFARCLPGQAASAALAEPAPGRRWSRASDQTGGAGSRAHGAGGRRACRSTTPTTWGRRVQLCDEHGRLPDLRRGLRRLWAHGRPCGASDHAKRFCPTSCAPRRASRGA